jgi:purine-binding chemotaxis protein CheW
MQTTYLKINVAEQVLLINLKQTCLVLPLVELQKIPGNDPALEGILNYHGQALPVYCLAYLINAPQFEYNLDTPLLLCKISSGLLGVIVSEVLDVVDLPNDMIQPPNVHQVMPYVDGIFEDEQWSAWLLNLEKLMVNHQGNLGDSS